MRVSDLMTRDPLVVPADMDVHELEQVFLERRIHGAPVVDRDGRLVGLVSQTDVLHWHHDAGTDEVGEAVRGRVARGQAHDAAKRGMSVVTLHTATVSELMTPIVHAIRPEEDAAEAARRMIRHRIHRLVVVDGDLRVLGVLSAMDLLRLVPGAGTPRG